MVLSTGLIISLAFTTFLCVLLFLYIRQKTNSVESKIQSLFEFVKDETERISNRGITVSEAPVSSHNSLNDNSPDVNVERKVDDYSDSDSDSDSDDDSGSEDDSDDEDFNNNTLIEVSSDENEGENIKLIESVNMVEDKSNEAVVFESIEKEREYDEDIDVDVSVSIVDGDVSDDNDDGSIVNEVLERNTDESLSVNLVSTRENVDNDDNKSFSSMGSPQSRELTVMDDSNDDSHYDKSNSDTFVKDVKPNTKPNYDSDDSNVSIKLDEGDDKPVVKETQNKTDKLKGVNLSKMPVAKLRDLAQELNLTDNPKKVKKNELIKLLSK